MILPLPLDIHTATAASSGDAESATSAEPEQGVFVGVSIADSTASAVYVRGVCMGWSSAGSMPAAAACCEGSMRTKAIKPTLCRKVRH